jgi:hypothetical protein
VDAATGMAFADGDFRIDGAYRFDGAVGWGDSSNLYAISVSRDSTKGLVIDAFDLQRRDLNEAFSTPPLVALHDDSEFAAMKYGVPKVLKAEFNADPDRYVLRKGFPDFPECPFGQEFSMLGFDRLKMRYVWLVTSIFKDERLTVETYAEVA